MFDKYRVISIFHSSGIGTFVIYIAMIIPGNKNIGPFFGRREKDQLDCEERDRERGRESEEGFGLPPYSPDQ